MTRSTNNSLRTHQTNSPFDNYLRTMQLVGYVPRSEATPETYASLGFKSGLEIHQQLLTQKKLFCNCPAGFYQKDGEYDAQVIRHMRPTLSEMGEYDGTALMEKKTRKTIVYRIKSETACTYDIDDTPPFKINRDALKIALEISLLLKTNIVGELHITRKQYLDGSIPTGFQRTAIVGIEGNIPLRNKQIGIIQLSIEEDSCREVSDIGHLRVYTTDRLGMPLIETVTYPHMLTPDEVAEVAQYLRMLCRTSGHVRTGLGAAREDVNVSITGGTRIEIKGVAHISWIPELTHNEAFRQKALLDISKILNERVHNAKSWMISHRDVTPDDFGSGLPYQAGVGNQRLTIVNLPDFKNILSFFTQPGKTFADELSERLKVIACLECPNLIQSEHLEQPLSDVDLATLRELLGAGDNDAQVIVWGPTQDVDTALETIEERCRWAFEGVPNETRKGLPDGTTIFERVLPGPDRMYPDTDSAPIPITSEMIESTRKTLPAELGDLLVKFREWSVPEDCYRYLVVRRLSCHMERIVKITGWPGRFVGTLFGHALKGLERRQRLGDGFTCDRVVDLCEYVHGKGLDKEMALAMLPETCLFPTKPFEAILDSFEPPPLGGPALKKHIPDLVKQFSAKRTSQKPGAAARWVTGQLRSRAVGGMPLRDLAALVTKEVGHE
jgi:glutamyl-tRNA(Gln) amidotransferase subunit E